jgi:hypothetical protein
MKKGIITTLTEGKVLIERWRKEYNQACPHGAKNYHPPALEAIMTVALT